MPNIYLCLVLCIDISWFFSLQYMGTSPSLVALNKSVVDMDIVNDIINWAVLI